MNLNAFLIVILSLVCSDISACIKTPLSPKEALAAADVVFQGKVENIQFLDDPANSKLEARMIVSFSASKYWKGTENKLINIHTTYNRSSCNGFKFKNSQEYLVFASFNSRGTNFLSKLLAPKVPTLGVKVYGGTTLLSEADLYLQELGK